jgi:hypothetical protein
MPDASQATETGKRAFLTLLCGASLKVLSDPMEGDVESWMERMLRRSGAGFGRVVRSGVWVMMSEVMWLQELVATTRMFGEGAEGCFDGEKCARSGFGLDWRPVFQWPNAEDPGEEQHTWRRGIRKGPRRKPFWGGSDPL